MIARLLVPLFAFTAFGSFAQVGIYGPIKTHVKAGDVAPDITVTETLRSPVPSSWSQSNLSGQVTALAFFPDTSHNLQAVTMWNATIEKFAGKPVQFVWITGEQESTLQPWLAQHPIQGWVLQDAMGKTGNAYGMELPTNVIVGADRRIIGFDEWVEEQTLKAVLEGRVTTTPPTKETMKAFRESHQILLAAEPRRMPEFDKDKPRFVPSETVHIAPSQGEGIGSYTSSNSASLKGYSLKQAIEEVFGDAFPVDPVRMQFPASLEHGKLYDFSLVLPKDEDPKRMKIRFQKAIEDYFHLSVRRENRVVNVYVVTIDQQHGPPTVETLPHDVALIRSTELGFGTASSSDLLEQKVGDLSAIRFMSFDGIADDFCHQLEDFVDRPVVNETNLEGTFKVDIERSDTAKDDFLKRLHDQTGLVITPGERNVEMLVVEAN
jgi:uncharacterized protein (TIGR03435 family)